MSSRYYGMLQLDEIKSTIDSLDIIAHLGNSQYARLSSQGPVFPFAYAACCYGLITYSEA